jgi:hypothetical protein
MRGKLISEAWDSLTEGERRADLMFVGIWKFDEIVFHEATLKWNQLLPSTQEKLKARILRAAQRAEL